MSAKRFNVINQVRDFYLDNEKWSGENYISEETAEYKRK